MRTRDRDSREEESEIEIERSLLQMNVDFRVLSLKLIAKSGRCAGEGLGDGVVVVEFNSRITQEEDNWGRTRSVWENRRRDVGRYLRCCCVVGW